MPARRLSLFLAAALGLAAQAGMAAGGNVSFYCCIDASGKQTCGDILPHTCYGRAYRELGADGRTLRQVDAPLTAEQRAQRAADEKRRQAEEEALKEQQRKDQALLNTYGSEADIEALRQRAEADVHKSIKSAEERIAQIRQQRKKFEDEAEFYKKKTLPAEVQKGLKNTDFEIKAQESIIQAKKKELELIKAKYDDDLRRFQELNKRPPAEKRH